MYVHDWRSSGGVLKSHDYITATQQVVLVTAGSFKDLTKPEISYFNTGFNNDISRAMVNVLSHVGGVK